MSLMTIAILDYGAGNLQSVLHACTHLGYQAVVTDNPDALLKASHIIVPGQGAFKQAMTQIASRRLTSVLLDIIQSEKPFLGICLGFEILFNSSEEHGGASGLGVFPGRFVPIPAQPLKVPHIGWNTVKNTKEPMFKSLSEKSHFYFVHSYYIVDTDPDIIAATTDYGQNFVSAVAKGSVWGTQFHPEKSSASGLQLLDNFLSLT